MILHALKHVPVHALDGISQALWRDVASGRMSDTEAEIAQALIERRRKHAKYQPLGRRIRTSSPDRQESLLRRRKLASAGGMPPSLAHMFTCGEQAVLFIIAAEVIENGDCRLPLGNIAARAGVSETKARQAIREAKQAGLIIVQERRRKGLPSLTNIVSIISLEWLSWLNKGRVHFSKGDLQSNIYRMGKIGSVLQPMHLESHNQSDLRVNKWRKPDLQIKAPKHGQSRLRENYWSGTRM